ncbi:glycosyltransferase family 2 protein [Butyrivibrio sp. LC3010]|uniref:glycosyltransferase family 2 protein n=1 Tax=Butyrivibrio sp. LC3010 TaxID=1280680 RepID=UPI00042707DF|nr:glycosyltransferase family 2 protein [Butyrivibrio sp. LC3010]
MSDKLIIIPAYNEGESICGTISKIKEDAPDFDYIIINDCSTDDTLQKCISNGYNYLNLPINLGIGGAVQTGYKYAAENNYKIAVQVDGDGQHDPSFLSKMEETLIKENADMVIGSRFITKEGFQSTLARRIGIGYFTKLIKLFTGETITDPTSGLRMVGRDLIELFAIDYPRDYPEPESLVKAIKNQRKVIEIPVIMKERQGGQSSIRLKKSVYYMIKVSLAIVLELLRKHKSFKNGENK